MAEGKLRCPLCGEKLRLDYAFASNDIERHKLKWHYYCKCGLWFPLRDTPEEALAVAKRLQWHKQEAKVDEKRKL